MACLNRSRTLEAPCRRTSPQTRTGDGEKRTFDSPATALASMVCQCPEGRTSNRPLGMEAPISHIFSDCADSPQFPVSFLCFILTGNIAEMDALRGLHIDLGAGISRQRRTSWSFAAGLLDQFFAQHWPIPIKNKQRQMAVVRKLTQGEVVFSACLVKVAPASYSRWVRVGRSLCLSG